MKYLVVLLLAGCAGSNATWTKPGGTDADLKKDLEACRSSHSMAVLALGIGRAEIEMEKCMNERGWAGKYEEHQPPK